MMETYPVERCRPLSPYFVELPPRWAWVKQITEEMIGLPRPN